MNIKLKNTLPYISAVILFIILSIAYFPDALQGKRLNQHDKLTWQGGANETLEHQKQTGERTFWTNSMFGGMPTYLVSSYGGNNVSKYFARTLSLGMTGKYKPIGLLVSMLIGFWIALLLFKVDPWLSIVGAVTLALSSYYLIIIEAGHITKFGAIAVSGPIIAGVYHAYKHNSILGTIAVTIFLSIQLILSHLQITYYTLLIVLIFLIFQIKDTIVEKKYNQFIKSSLILLVGVILAVSTNFYQLLTTYDYGKDSIRGKSELTFNADNKTGGLDKDYATRWSYGKLETFNLLIPNLYGGASTQELSESSETYKTLKQFNAQNPKQIIKRMPTYWGGQPFTSGPVYVGALAIFLFVLGIFLVKGSTKWWLITVTIVSILLAWGHNLYFLTSWFLDYFPLYNKFRTVSMILVMAEISIPLLGILAVKNILENKVSKAEIINAIKWSAGILASIILIFLLNPGILDFQNPSDNKIFGKVLTEAIQKDRASLMRTDALRSLIFIAIGAGAIWLYTTEKLKKEYLLTILALSILVDLWAVNKRYLNSDDFVSKQAEQNSFVKTPADQYILSDKSLDYRVLNLSVSTFNDASTSYHHKSIGGYHGAKMRRYQDVIDFHLFPEIEKLGGIFSKDNLTMQMIDSVMKELPVLNMLNAKYIIVNPQGAPVANYNVLGNAWYVNDYKIVNSANEEISALLNPNEVQKVVELINQKTKIEAELNSKSKLIKQAKVENKPNQQLNLEYQQKSMELGKINQKLKSMRNFNPKKTAIINKEFASELPKIQQDTTASIILTLYKPNELKYKTSAKTQQLAVFSEVYYKKGWNAYIDGKPTDHFRANYILRAMKIPAGNHEITFRFEPQIAKVGLKVSLIGSILQVILIIAGIGLLVMQKRKEEQKTNA